MKTPPDPRSDGLTLPWEALDGHALRVLDILLEECNVSNAARRLQISQPAVSLILKRLRVILGDPLLVRGRHGMILTERGSALIGPVRQAIAQFELMLMNEQTDPQQFNRVINIALPDFLAAPLLSHLVAQLQQQAPHLRLNFHTLSLEHYYTTALEQGELDFVIGNWLNPPRHLRTLLLFEDDVVCLMSQRHPLAQRSMSRSDYEQAWHILPTPQAVGERGTIDRTLREQGVVRRVLVQIPYFHMAPYMLMENQALFSCSRVFAAHYCQMLPLTLQRPPIEFEPFSFYLLWHDRSQLDPVSRWLRQFIAQSLREHTAQLLAGRQ